MIFYCHLNEIGYTINLIQFDLVSFERSVASNDSAEKPRTSLHIFNEPAKDESLIDSGRTEKMRFLVYRVRNPIEMVIGMIQNVELRFVVQFFRFHRKYALLFGFDIRLVGAVFGRRLNPVHISIGHGFHGRTSIQCGRSILSWKGKSTIAEQRNESESWLFGDRKWFRQRMSTTVINTGLTRTFHNVGIARSYAVGKNHPFDGFGCIVRGGGSFAQRRHGHWRRLTGRIDFGFVSQKTGHGWRGNESWRVGMNFFICWHYFRICRHNCRRRRRWQCCRLGQRRWIHFWPFGRFRTQQISDAVEAVLDSAHHLIKFSRTFRAFSQTSACQVFVLLNEFSFLFLFGDVFRGLKWNDRFFIIDHSVRNCGHNFRQDQRWSPVADVRSMMMAVDHATTITTFIFDLFCPRKTFRHKERKLINQLNSFGWKKRKNINWFLIVFSVFYPNANKSDKDKIMKANRFKIESSLLYSFAL